MDRFARQSPPSAVDDREAPPAPCSCRPIEPPGYDSDRARAVAEHVVDESARWADVELGGPTVDVVNNVGSELTPEGFGVDRGRPTARRSGLRRASRRVRVERRRGAASSRVPRRRRTLRRAPLHVLRRSRPVVAGFSTVGGATARCRRRSFATSTPRRASTDRASSATTTRATTSWCSAHTRRPSAPCTRRRSTCS